MALVIHIAVALLGYLVRSRFSAPPPAHALTGSQLVRVYLSSLLTRVLVPYLLAELLCQWLHAPRDFRSLVLLLPHFYMVLIRKEILDFIQQALSDKK